MRRPDGSEFLPPLQIATGPDGSPSHKINSHGFLPGTYEHWAEDDATGLMTDAVSFEVTEALFVDVGGVFPNQAEPGQTIDLVYCIRNPSGMSLETVLSASMRSTGTTEPSIMDPGRRVTVEAPATAKGECQDQSRQFLLPPNLADGLYDVTWTLERADGSGEYDQRKYEAILRVGPEPDQVSPEQQLAEKFAPILYLASGDYEPKEVQIMLNEPGPEGRTNCSTELRLHYPDEISLGQCPSVETLAGIASDPNTYLDILDMSPGDKSLLENPYRERYQLLESRYDTVTYASVGRERVGGQLFVDYWFFYYYDFGTFGPDHEGDWERIRVRTGALTLEDALSRDAGTAIGMSQHMCDGTAIPLVYEPWSRDYTHDETHPVIYVARGSHANFLSEGRQAFNPLCSTQLDWTFRHTMVTPSVILIDCDNPTPDQEWLAFRGRWGEWGGGPHGPCRGQQIQPGGTISQLESIARDQLSALFIATWDLISGPGGITGFQSGSNASDIRMSLTSPSGRLIDRDTVATDVEHELTATSERFTITDPEPGDWTITIFAADVPPDGASVEIGFGTVPEPIVFGEESCDGEVNPVDAALVLQLSAGLLDALECEDEADTNLDGQINPVDASLILQFVAGLISSLPP